MQTNTTQKPMEDKTMIKANEVRIGNLINYNEGGIFRVIGIHEFGLDVENDIETAYTEHESFSPIPLTEEWLLKFGFEVYKFDHKKNQYRFKDRLIVIRDDLFCDYGTGVIIKHVHQLQNLYFCLCGEELTIKEVNNEQ